MNKLLVLENYACVLNPINDTQYEIIGICTEMRANSPVVISADIRPDQNLPTSRPETFIIPIVTLEPKLSIKFIIENGPTVADRTQHVTKDELGLLKSWIDLELYDVQCPELKPYSQGQQHRLERGDVVYLTINKSIVAIRITTTDRDMFARTQGAVMGIYKNGVIDNDACIASVSHTIPKKIKYNKFNNVILDTGNRPMVTFYTGYAAKRCRFKLLAIAPNRGEVTYTLDSIIAKDSYWKHNIE